MTRGRAAMERQRLGREEWLRAARLALLRGGAAAVRVERLAEELGVTKGSFYWHYRNRGELLEALLAEWEGELAEAGEALSALQGRRGREAVQALIAFLQPRVVASEAGETPSDAAIFAWAASDEGVAGRVNAAEAERVAFMQGVVGDEEVGEFVYLAYLGFVMRRRRDPSAAGFFPALGRIAEGLASVGGNGEVEETSGPAAAAGAGA